MQKDIRQWRCRYAPSLGALEDTPLKVWDTPPYYKDYKGPTIFFGLYGFNDFATLWRYQGKKAILWAGSDITHFINGYWLDEKGKIRIEPEAFAKYINENCDNYVENGAEHTALSTIGIDSKIVPSFLGNIDDYEVFYAHEWRPEVYASVSGDNFAMYGWEQIELIADKCDVDFHLYGNTAPWVSKHSNVFVHGRVPKEQMNNEIKKMQCGLRVLDFDGFSEVLAKSVLWGQWPISRIYYPHITNFTTNDELIEALNDLKNKTRPNMAARNYYINNLNKYPWNGHTI